MRDPLPAFLPPPSTNLRHARDTTLLCFSLFLLLFCVPASPASYGGREQGKTWGTVLSFVHHPTQAFGPSAGERRPAAPSVGDSVYIGPPEAGVDSLWANTNRNPPATSRKQDRLARFSRGHRISQTRDSERVGEKDAQDSEVVRHDYSIRTSEGGGRDQAQRSARKDPLESSGRQEAPSEGLKGRSEDNRPKTEEGGFARDSEHADTPHSIDFQLSQTPETELVNRPGSFHQDSLRPLDTTDTRVLGVPDQPTLLPGGPDLWHPPPLNHADVFPPLPGYNEFGAPWSGTMEDWGPHKPLLGQGGVMEEEEDELDSILFHWPLGGSQVAPNIVPGMSSESGCGCWDTDSKEREVECSCWGPSLVEVPANLSSAVNIIAVTNAGVEILRNDSFTRYRSTLQEIVLEDLENLHTIEAGVFRGLPRLQTIYIHSAPALLTMPNFTFTQENAKLLSLRITRSGLQKIPVMKFAGRENILNIIDLESNRISKVIKRSLEVRVEQLLLNYNNIESVEEEAFSGSAIGRLSFKGNTHLTYIHPNAFSGIESLQTLDLSETSITSLPTYGLKGLEVLRLENTPTLKVFPSVYSFRTIQEAHLTYPYHCCAFQFPETHDREQYIRHQEFIRKQEEELCSDVTSPSNPVLSSNARVRRRRRHLVTPTLSTPDPQRLHEMQNEKEMQTKQRVNLALPSEIISNPSKRIHTAGRIHRRQDSQDLSKRRDPALSRTALSPRTRHYEHRTRIAKENSRDADETQPHTTVLGYPSDVVTHVVGGQEPRARSRRRDGARMHPLIDRSSESAIHSPDSRFLADADKIRLQDEGPKPSALDEIIPSPDKRFGKEEFPDNGDDVADKESFVGRIPGNGYPSSFLGFGSFNYSSDRYPTDASKSNESASSGRWGGHQGWARGPPPPLDSGDDDTYGLYIPHDGGHALGFPEATDGEGFHEATGGGFRLFDETDDEPLVPLHHDNSWHPIQAPLNNTTIIVLCGNISKNYHDVLCIPAPDAFNPCEDIMGNLALRVAVWFVVVTAVVGNLAVMLVLVSSKFRMTVSKFLMVNLAIADLCMGVYLLIIAAMDLHTIGVYFNYAIDWQNGPGCKVAGFLTVFASELSIFTLTVITSERWYAITYAIHLNKRLKLSMAAKIMVLGWIYSISMATLPLVGISGYSKTSICLPMETGDALALAYLISLLLVNGLAFFVITACYASMYCSISRHDATATHSDLTVAKRMALLVFTDFACWAPIAFFGLTAVAGLPLINVTRAKILLVFFYPLNSCANPYLYAILTKQYRRDLFILLARHGFCTKRAMRYKGAYSSVNNTFPHNTVVNAPNHRNSTLTQITLCDLTRTARASQQSNNGSLLGTMVGGSQDSLQRSVSPSRTPTKPETCCAETERLSTVQEMSHSTHSDDESSDHAHANNDGGEDDDGPSGIVKQAGSPHPIKNCYTRLPFTPEQEKILKQALHESKVKKKAKGDALREHGSQIPEENEKLIKENGNACQEMKTFGRGEAIVVCEVEVRRSGERSSASNRNLDEIEATSTV
ncbi:uncharacterized protein LOC125040805 isoform X2 [Penaeus chinensis]|uniref:uncharacterized protein LOC125040805 isoform X2 n=1 Tax=Penaeus chinensis TaxID=139456 RepID=UPI001FB6FDCC|nr:uncharacterized protein LOC125040805 isoform X2 [Penaeus chinensis]